MSAPVMFEACLVSIGDAEGVDLSDYAGESVLVFTAKPKEIRKTASAFGMATRFCIVDDAALIASAPELLEALEKCTSALAVSTTPLPEDRAAVLEAQAAARAAIEKARGGR